MLIDSGSAGAEPGECNIAFSHQQIDCNNAAQDRFIARQLSHNRQILISARRNLRRWMARDGRRPRRAYIEWQRILEHLTAQQIADFLMSDTPMARRLRQSSPFIGPLPGKTRSTRSK